MAPPGHGFRPRRRAGSSESPKDCVRKIAVIPRVCSGISPRLDFLREAPLRTCCYEGALAPTEGSRRQHPGAGSVLRGQPHDGRDEILRSRANGWADSSSGEALPQEINPARRGFDGRSGCASALEFPAGGPGRSASHEVAAAARAARMRWRRVRSHPAGCCKTCLHGEAPDPRRTRTILPRRPVRTRMRIFRVIAGISVSRSRCVLRLLPSSFSTETSEGEITIPLKVTLTVDATEAPRLSFISSRFCSSRSSSSPGQRLCRRS
jgi:hypothetical protein